MDNLTHGLFGLAVGALRRPEGGAAEGTRLSPTDKATLLACVLAAELPDLDSLWPMPDAVLGVLQAHRGPSHSLLLAPVVAAVATGLCKALFRGARPLPVFLQSVLAVLFAHLLPDLWTGWGTRLLWPFSDQRLSLDWTLVVDPFVTVPLLAGALWALVRRARWRRAVLAGLLVSCAYVGVRVLVQDVLTQGVKRLHPDAEQVAVFPSWFGPGRWRFVAVLPGEYRLGEVRFGGEPSTVAMYPRGNEQVVPPQVLALPTVRETLAWARFPLVDYQPLPGGGHRLRISDLRYHLEGKPTLAFELTLDSGPMLRQATFERGGSARELFERWRSSGATAP